MLTKERTLVESYIIPRLLSSTMRFILVSSIYKTVLFHTVAKSMLDKVIVIRTIKTVILLRYTKFIGTVRSFINIANGLEFDTYADPDIASINRFNYLRDLI